MKSTGLTILAVLGAIVFNQKFTVADKPLKLNVPVIKVGK